MKITKRSKKKSVKIAKLNRSNIAIAILLVLLLGVLAIIYVTKDAIVPPSHSTMPFTPRPQTNNTDDTSVRSYPKTQEEKHYDALINDVNVTYPADWKAANGNYYAPGDDIPDIAIGIDKKIIKEEVPLAEYVEKYAGWETGPSRTPAQITTISTQSGLTGYKVEWESKGRRMFTTFFEVPNDTSSTFQIEYTGDQYISIYDSMISSFSF